MAHDVFISHSSDDKTAADATCAVLESRGIRCWIAPRDIRPGADWGESIIDAINQARAFVLVFSSHANRSSPVRREVERAINRSLPVIPLRIENVTPEKSLEYFISMAHWLDAFNQPLEEHLNYLADILNSILDNKEVEPPSRREIPAAKPVQQQATTRLAAIAAGLAVVLLVAGGFAFWKFGAPHSGSPISPSSALIPAASSPAASPAPAASAQSADPLRLDLVTDCDRLAGLPGDPQKPPGVFGVMSPDRINTVSAGPACEAALREYPGVARFVYQTGRVALGQKNYSEAYRLYEKAATAGSVGAMNGLGYLYENGFGVAQNWLEARAWYQTAATAGNATAMTNLGNLYVNGTGVPKDADTARQWYAKAAAAGDQAGARMLRQLDVGGK
jgi:hypothetical protein